MDKQIVDTYKITNNTMALIPCLHLDFQTIVHETDRVIYVKQPCMEIINNACLDGGSTYEGRRAIIIRDFNHKKKLTIMIDRYKKLYIFPTHSPENALCCWFMFEHVDEVNPFNGNKKISEIKFRNGKVLTLPISTRIFHRQMYRAFLYKQRYSKPFI